MAADGRVALTVQSPFFQGMDCARMSLQGVVSPVPEEDKPRLREVFLKKYPSAFYVDFGDFRWFRVDKVVAVRFNGGFGRAPKLRLPFPSPAEDRKSIKEAIVEMTKKARGAAAANARTPGGTL
ncbi:hypothetical protein TSOC_000823 [Tetrabaena socialis]|uniref:Uncharacterized protein n=1 Tax=Tetrabaena socialis TaxID=47790 RepID=A0A2J8AIA6_9CHLO|nr:hypothetical protein TSOC_000823 [Tetrabaena socialis]|eukprot:PNH12245.1 hypothetical protein TSOC_000823 [Tetrabaena socialis]